MHKPQSWPYSSLNPDIKLRWHGCAKYIFHCQPVNFSAEGLAASVCPSCITSAGWISIYWAAHLFLSITSSYKHLIRSRWRTGIHIEEGFSVVSENFAFSQYSIFSTTVELCLFPMKFDMPRDIAGLRPSPTYVQIRASQIAEEYQGKCLTPS